MKPTPFDHMTAESVGQALSALASHESARVLAGGQSLVPLLALRQTRPSLLVDINALDLDHVEQVVERNDRRELRLGTLVRHRRLERDPMIRDSAPLLAEAAGFVGSPAIRHRGTLGGSLAHADPSAELPTVLLALHGSVLTQSPRGQRIVAASDLFTGPHSTSLAPDELLVEIVLPLAGPGHGAAFCEWAARHGDLPAAGLAVAVERGADGLCHSARAAACGVAATPLDLTTALSPAIGESAATDGLLREIASRVRAAIAGQTADIDLDRHRQSPWDRAERHDEAELAGLLAARALHRAFTRSTPPIDATRAA
jgi:aerobic carbon-monoxide dehydrogenase medium subunit